MEVNAGLGVLTEFLLKAHIPRLRIYEGETSLYRELYVMFNMIPILINYSQTA